MFQAGVPVVVTGTPRGPPHAPLTHSFGPCLPPHVCQRDHPEATGAPGDLVGAYGRPHSPPVIPAGHTARKNRASATICTRHHPFIFAPHAHRSPLQGHRYRRLFAVYGRPEHHFPRRLTRTVRYRPGAATICTDSSVPLRGLLSVLFARGLPQGPRSKAGTAASMVARGGPRFPPRAVLGDIDTVAAPTPLFHHLSPVPRPA